MTGEKNPEISTALAVKDPVAADEAQAALEWNHRRRAGPGAGDAAERAEFLLV